MLWISSSEKPRSRSRSVTSWRVSSRPFSIPSSRAKVMKFRMSLSVVMSCWYLAFSSGVKLVISAESNKSRKISCLGPGPESPDLPVAKTASGEQKRNICPFAKWGMLRLSAYKGDFATGASDHGHRASILPRRVYRNKQFCAKSVYSNKQLHCWTYSSRSTSPALFRRQPIFTARLRNSSFWAVSLFLLMARSDRRSAARIAVDWSGLDLSTQMPMPSYFQVWVTCRRWPFSS